MPFILQNLQARGLLSRFRRGKKNKGESSTQHHETEQHEREHQGEGEAEVDHGSRRSSSVGAASHRTSSASEIDDAELAASLATRENYDSYIPHAGYLGGPPNGQTPRHVRTYDHNRLQEYHQHGWNPATHFLPLPDHHPSRGSAAVETIPAPESAPNSGHTSPARSSAHNSGENSPVRDNYGGYWRDGLYYAP
jgi:hypothetical protein